MEVYHVMEIQPTRDEDNLRALLGFTDKIDAHAFLVDGCLTTYTTTTEGCRFTFA